MATKLTIPHLQLNEETAFIPAFLRNFRAIQDYINGSLTRGWKDWTPTYANLTIGNGVVIARYQEVGDLIHLSWQFTLGSTSAVGTNPTISLPISATRSNFMGPGQVVDAGTAAYAATCTTINTTTFILMPHDVTLANHAIFISLAATTPFTWTTNDLMNAELTYERG